jgi:hypothetical protein
VEWVAFGAVAVLYLYLNSGTWLISPDSTDYVEGARSLAALRGFVDATGTPITFFPPGASAVYALAALIPSPTYVFFNALTKLLVLVYLALSFLVVRRSAGRGVALLTLLFLALSATLMSESTRILSDILFSATFMLTVWLFPPDRLEHLRPREALVLGVLVSCCYLVRTAGLFVPLGYMAYILLCVRRNRIQTLTRVAAVFLAVAVVLALRAMANPAGYSYLRVMTTKEPWVADSGLLGPWDLVERAWTSLRVFAHDVAVVVSNQEGLGVHGAFICLLMALGLVRGLVERRSILTVLFLLAYAPALVLMEPVPRYLLPMLPLLVLFVVDGAELTLAMVPGEQARRAVAVGILAFICVNPYWQRGFTFGRETRKDLDRLQGVAIVHPGHEAFLDLVRANGHALSPADVIATNHANILRYFVPPEVSIRPLPLIVNVDRAYLILKKAGATYLYCDKIDRDIWGHIDPVIKDHPSSFELVAEKTDAAIYRMLP